MTSRIRHVAAVALVGLLVATAGCSMLGGGSQSNLLLVNDDDTSHDVAVEIVDGDETVYTEETSVDGETDTELSSFDESGEYTLYVTVDGRETQLTYEFSGDDTVSIGIDNDGNVFMG